MLSYNIELDNEYSKKQKEKTIRGAKRIFLEKFVARAEYASFRADSRTVFKVKT